VLFTCAPGIGAANRLSAEDNRLPGCQHDTTAFPAASASRIPASVPVAVETPPESMSPLSQMDLKLRTMNGNVSLVVRLKSTPVPSSQYPVQPLFAPKQLFRL